LPPLSQPVPDILRQALYWWLRILSVCVIAANVSDTGFILVIWFAMVNLVGDLDKLPLDAVGEVYDAR
jgi:hypothetical protein